MSRPAEKTTKQRTNFAAETLRKLEDAFCYGMTNREACFVTGISESLFYEVCSNNRQLSERFKLLQDSPRIQALRNVVDEINKGDVKLSQWYLERRDRDFNPRTVIQNEASEEQQQIITAIGQMIQGN